MDKERKNILLVEDDRGHAELIHRAFEACRDRFTLSIVTNLRDARVYLKNSLPHLIITDLILPDGKGLELLTSREETRECPLMVMTGFGDEQVAVDSLKAGALDYVVKLESSLRDMPRIADRVIRQWENIVERKRMEIALAASEEKFRALIERAGDLIVIMDMNGIYRYLSPAVEDITGFKAEDLIGKMPSEFLHPDDEIAVYEILHQAMEKPGITVPIPNFRVRHQDGRWINLQGVVTNMKDVPGVNGMVLNCRDVSDLKRMEEGLQRIQKLESVGVLAGGIAHDFNNLLTVVLGNLAVGKLANSREKLINALNEAEKAVLNARELTQQLLTFARGGAPVKETASIREIIEDSAGFSLRGSNASLVLDFQEDLYPADVDRGQMSQVINNLVINAQQSMPNGGVVTIRAVNTEMREGNVFGLTPGKYIRIEVIDQGIGIEPDHKHKIFDPYFSTKHKGSGLGLAIVHSIIKKHNGFVDFRSQPGKGTTFLVFLPASEGEVPEKPVEAESVEGEGNILVVDDDESIREVAALLLETLGYIVTTVRSGEEAVELCKRESFDAVILDLTIPGGMGGKDAAREIRQFDKDIKLIVSSGYSNDPVMSRFRDYGFDGVLMKPYKIERVSETMRNLLNPD